MDDAIELLVERIEEVLDELEPDVGIARSVLLDIAAQLTVDYWEPAEHVGAVKDLVEWIEIWVREQEQAGRMVQ